MNFTELLQGLKDVGKFDESTNTIILSATEDYTIEVSTDTFKIFFADVLDNISYESLIGTHDFDWSMTDENGNVTVTHHNLTAEQLGYKQYFDEWKELGIFDVEIQAEPEVIVDAE